MLDTKIRHSENICSIINKIKSLYPCNHEQCPFIKDRLEQHKFEHHTSNSLSHRSHSKRSQTVSISPMPSIMKRITNSRYTDNPSMKPVPKCMELNHTVQDNINNEVLKPDKDTSYSRHTFRCAKEFYPDENKISYTTRNCVLKDDLEDAVQRWFEDIPIYPNITPSVQNLRKNSFNAFVEKIYILTNEHNTYGDYEEKVRIEIDNFLNSLPVWYPGDQCDQELLREGIKNNFFSKIRDLCTKMHDNKPILIDDGVKSDASLHILPSNSIINDQIEKLVETEILDWLLQIQFKDSEDIGNTINIISLTDIFSKRLIPLLRRPVKTRNYKLVLKGLIIDTLNDLSSMLQYPKNKRPYLNRIAQELTNRILYVQLKCRNSNSCQFPRDKNMHQWPDSDLKCSMLEGLRSCIGEFQIHSRVNIIEDITDILLDCLESIFLGDVFLKKDETCKDLSNSTGTSESQLSITSAVMENVKDVLTEDIMKQVKYCNETQESILFNTVSVFTSGHDLYRHFNAPVTSTPKRKSDNTERNSDEIAYTTKVSNLIRAWMDTLPKNFSDDKNFKETALKDLAGDIIDEVKLEQLAPKTLLDRNKIMTYIILRWLYRFDVFDELSADTPQIKELIRHCNEITVPNLTIPRKDNLQVIGKAKVDTSKQNLLELKRTDVLKDQILIWMNEQPTKIYSKNDKNFHTEMVHDLAVKLQNKKSREEIGTEISKWLKKVLKSSEKKNIEKLSHDLSERILKIPHDQIIEKHLHDKVEGKLLDDTNRSNLNEEQIKDNPQILTEAETDQTLKEFITKFMEHNYEIDDSIARYAFGELLKTEFRKLLPPKRKEMYENFAKTKKYEDLSTERFEQELEYIKIVSDWLRNIPIQRTFNTPHNTERIEFVNNLAKNIYEVEEERHNSPTAMDYNMYLASIISQFIGLLPVLPEHNGNVMLMIDELIGKIIANRTPMQCCQKNANKTMSSKNSSGIQEQNISDFIEHYIHLNAGDFADDQMKMDAWSTRVLKEVKKIVLNTADPSTLNKAQVYNKLIDVSVPGEESVKLFSKELDYAREISDWMKNLPLLQNPEANRLRITLICELAETFLNREKNQLVHQSQAKSDVQIEEYIHQWVQKIPVEPRKELKIPILVQQLLKRIERIDTGQHQDIGTQENIKKQLSNTSKKSKTKSCNSRSKNSKCTSTCGTNKTTTSNRESSDIIVEIIENWSNRIPVQSNNKDEVINIKEEVTRKLYQKVGELSVDPQVMKDNSLFKELLADEINAQLNNVPKNTDLDKIKDNLRNELVENVMEAKNIAQEKAAGNNYKHQLENTIEASIPNPISNKQTYDPGFEIYKNRLADMFIIENFDHSNDNVKMRYERRIRHEIDKYFQNAQKRNVIPLNKNEIYNELYGALFKVPIPNEASTIQEVEEVKTRCEVDTWFATLPIREAGSLEELLEWDNILSMIAKRLLEIEQNENNPDEKIHGEIAKWVVKFPLLPGEESKVDKFANDLQNILKSSKEDRKCITNKSKDKETKKGKSNKSSKIKNTQVPSSPQPGPSSKGQNWVSPSPLQPPNNCQILPSPRKKPAELILEVVEAWCEQLPFPDKTAQDRDNNKIIRDNLLTRIIMKICELNSTPQIFNNSKLYDYFLEVELENLISDLPFCCDFEKIKEARKFQLKGHIKSLLPLMKEERARYEYKEELKTTIEKVLIEPLNSKMENAAMLNQIKEAIVDNFVLYNYNLNDDESMQVYKANIHNEVLKLFQNIKEDPPVNALIRQNQLICELAKVPVPTDRTLRDEVEEIKMKIEVQEFFDDLALPEEAEDKMAFRNNIKQSLAKQLYEIENMGNNCSKDEKMSKEIIRCLQKLNIEVNSDKVDAFINKLKMNKTIRRESPISDSIAAHSNNVDAKFYQTSIRESGVNHISGMNICDPRKDSRTLGIPFEDRGLSGEIPETSSYLILRNNKISSEESCPSQQFTAEMKPQAFQDCNSVDQPMGLAIDSPNIRNRRRRPTSDDEYYERKCKCGRKLRKLRGRRRCFMPMKGREECKLFGPIWLPMPYGLPPGLYYC